MPTYLDTKRDIRPYETVLCTYETRLSASTKTKTKTRRLQIEH